MTTVDAILEQYGMPAGGIADYVMTDAEIDALNRRRAYDKGIMLAYPREGVDQEFIFGGIGKSISKVAKGIKKRFQGSSAGCFTDCHGLRVWSRGHGFKQHAGRCLEWWYWQSYAGWRS
jgi:hypothetical protein